MKKEKKTYRIDFNGYYLKYRDYEIFNNDSNFLLLKCNDLIEDSARNRFEINTKELFSNAIRFGKRLYKELKDNTPPFKTSFEKRYYMFKENRTITLKGNPIANENIKIIIIEWCNMYGVPYDENDLEVLNDNSFREGTICIYRLIDLLVFCYLCHCAFNLGKKELLFINEKDNGELVIKKSIYKIITSIDKTNMFDYQMTFEYDKDMNDLYMTLKFKNIYAIIWYELKLFLCSLESVENTNGREYFPNYRICANANCRQPFIASNNRQLYCEDCCEEQTNEKYMRYYYKKKDLCEEIKQLFNKKKSQGISQDMSKRIKEILSLNASGIKKLKITELNDIIDYLLKK